MFAPTLLVKLAQSEVGRQRQQQASICLECLLDLSVKGERASASTAEITPVVERCPEDSLLLDRGQRSTAQFPIISTDGCARHLVEEHRSGILPVLKTPLRKT